MIKDGAGGGKTKSGLVFEERVDLISLFEKIDGYEVKETENKSGSYIVGSSQNIVIIRVSYPGVRSRTRYYNGSFQMTESHVHLP